MFEAAWKRKVQVDFRVTHQFELMATTEGLESITYDGQSVELPDAGW